MKLLRRPKPSFPKPGETRDTPQGSVYGCRFPNGLRLTLSKKAERKQPDLDAKAEARRKYRESRGLENHDCRDNLAHLQEFAKVQVVTFPNGKVREIPVITVTGLGEPLETTGVTITRWLKAGMLPAPVLTTSRGGNAYHLEEARSFMRIIGEHQQQFRQYRKDHTAVTDRIFRENALLRNSLFNVR